MSFNELITFFFSILIFTHASDKGTNMGDLSIPLYALSKFHNMMMFYSTVRFI